MTDQPTPPVTPIEPPPAEPRVVERRIVERRGAGVFRQFLLFVAGLLVGANGVYFWMQREAAVATTPPPSLPAPAGTPASAPVPGDARIVREPAARAAIGEEAGGPTADAPLQAAPAPSGLLLPVEGVQASQLTDTYSQARGESRVHDAIDIMAPAGTPVLAVADGTVEKLFESRLGGTTLYQFDAGGRHVYYYAHLQGYAPGIVEGKAVRRGEVIGYVGSSGNANAEAPHLHFAIGLLGPEGEWWDSRPINPYPLLGGR